MEERRIGIKVYTILFLVLLVGFVIFLVSVGMREDEYRERMAPKERFKNKEVSILNNNGVETLLVSFGRKI